jgi:dihydrodipicolinate synthase/N-acetylneuraminate lyase
MTDFPLPPPFVTQALHDGIAIPAHPLALDNRRRFDERRQQALTRYYLDAGAGGLAVGVHSTQFAIREPRYGLFEPVLKLAAQTIAAWEQGNLRAVVRIAGICGATPQAVGEARTAREFGYHAGLLSLGSFRDAPDQALIEHVRAVAREIPLFGFYLQPAAGGRLLSYPFWREFAEIPNLIGIKVAPFNRYATLDVVRAVARAGRAEEIALYTGNDDHIVLDLLCQYTLRENGQEVRVGFQGGLLGHWACWTKKAVAIHERCKAARRQNEIPADLLSLAGQVTDCNAAFFDPSHGYAGALCGIHEVLRRQGLLVNNYCLDEKEQLSSGQMDEIDRVYQAYPGLNDDEFVRQNLARWMDG